MQAVVTPQEARFCLSPFNRSAQGSEDTSDLRIASQRRTTHHDGSSQCAAHLPQVIRGNPLVLGGQEQEQEQELNFGIKRRWDDDVVFKNQDRGAPKKQQRFINDTIRCGVLACHHPRPLLMLMLPLSGAQYYARNVDSCKSPLGWAEPAAVCGSAHAYHASAVSSAGPTSTDASWTATSSSACCWRWPLVRRGPFALCGALGAAAQNAISTLCKTLVALPFWHLDLQQRCNAVWHAVLLNPFLAQLLVGFLII